MAYANLEKKREAGRRWYYKHKDRVHSYKIRARSERMQFIRKLKDVPCKDCGIRYPYYVMDFDHAYGNSKFATVNTLASTIYGWRIIKEEVKKCDIVCANCHRIRTYSRLHH